MTAFIFIIATLNLGLGFLLAVYTGYAPGFADRYWQFILEFDWLRLPEFAHRAATTLGPPRPEDLVSRRAEPKATDEQAAHTVA